MTAETRRYYFISGLPRSGSTLLAAILRQNPRFHAGMSGPLAGLIEAILGQVSAGSEMAPLVNEAQRSALLKGLFDSFYGDLSEPVVFDTNRAWTAKLPLLMRLFPETKLICTVRNVAWIMDSLERRYRSDPFENTRLFATGAQRSTVYTRVEALAGGNSLVGFPWHALREACWGDNAERLVLVDYDLLVARPADVIRLLYEFIGEEPYAHDFANVDYDEPTFDTQLGVRDLHKVHPNVAPRPRKTILPPDLFDRYAKLSFWQDIGSSKCFRIVAKPDGSLSESGTAAAMPVTNEGMG